MNQDTEHFSPTASYTAWASCKWQKSGSSHSMDKPSVFSKRWDENTEKVAVIKLAKLIGESNEEATVGTIDWNVFQLKKYQVWVRIISIHCHAMLERQYVDTITINQMNDAYSRDFRPGISKGRNSGMLLYDCVLATVYPGNEAQNWKA